MANYADFQLGIYLAGLGGEKPAFPVSFREVEAAAHAVMEPELLDYVAGGAGDERTQSANVDGVPPLGPRPPDAGRRGRAGPLGRPLRADPADPALHVPDRGPRA